MREYITRAEYLRSMLDNEGDETSNQSGQGGSQATANPKTGTSSKEVGWLVIWGGYQWAAYWRACVVSHSLL